MTSFDIALSALPPRHCGPYAERLVGKVGDNIRAVRLRLGLTQQEMSSACGIPQNRISTWESGKAEPTVSSLLKVCAGLSLPITAFTAGVNKQFDLTSQAWDQSSSSSHVGDRLNDPAATRMELERLRNLVAQYKAEARKVLTASDALDKVAIALAEIGKADEGTASRSGRARKAG